MTEGAAVLGVADAVGGDGEAVLEEGDAPREQDDQYEGPARRYLHFTQFEMPVPGERHEDVRADEHEYGPDSLHDAFVSYRGAKLHHFPD